MEQVPKEFARRLIDAARHEGRRSLDEEAAKQVLSAYGIEVPRSLRLAADGLMPSAFDLLVPPYVFKIMSPDVLHKSDMGGVRLGLSNAYEVLVARSEMASAAARAGVRVDGFLVEETAPPGHDVVVGGISDPCFGQTVMFGLGGIFVEVLKDVSFRICPILPLDAREMLRELRGAPILFGARGGTPVDEPQVVDLLMRVAGPKGMLEELADELAEVDLNPIILSANRAVAVDARFVLKERL